MNVISTIHRFTVTPLLLTFTLLSMFTLFPVSSVNAAETQASLQKHLQNRVEQAQKQLINTEKRIANARKNLAEELNLLELEVIALRKKAAVNQRLSDEKTLSLTALEERLAGWRTQHVYQQNLLHRFLQQHEQHSGEETATDKRGKNRLTTVIKVAKTLQQQLSPSWQENKIVMPSGEIKALQTLSVGPMTWYWDAVTEQAGIASIHDKSQGLLHSDLVLSGNEQAAIKNLTQQLTGEITFDPTLSRALVKEQNSESLLQHVTKGGVWAVPIILFAVFALVIALIKTAQLMALTKVVRFTPAVLTTVLTDLLSAKVDGKKTTPNNTQTAVINKLGRMQKALLDIASTPQSTRQRDDQLFMKLQDNKLWLDRWIGGIAVTAAISPLLGLLGTVSGMIETFKMMTLFGSGDPAVVSGGIAQALVTTELGLVVAIPALILNAVLSRRAKAYYSELEGFAILLSKADEENKPSTITTNKATEVATA